MLFRSPYIARQARLTVIRRAFLNAIPYMATTHFAGVYVTAEGMEVDDLYMDETTYLVISSDNDNNDMPTLAQEVAEFIRELGIECEVNDTYMSNEVTRKYQVTVEVQAKTV